MAVKFNGSLVLLLLVIASVSAIATRLPPYKCPPGGQKPPTEPKVIMVGGDKTWTYGVDYVAWAQKNGPFFVNDILEFKYDPPAPFAHDVYLLSDYNKYVNCDFTNATQIAAQGAGRKGVKYVLNESRWYFFGCSVAGGVHCKNGTMKFAVYPLPRNS